MHPTNPCIYDVWKFHRDSKGRGLSCLTKGFLRSVSAGIGSQKGVLRSLVRKEALAVKDANPREFARCRLDRSSGPGCRLLKRGWHDFSIARGCVPLLNPPVQADAQTLGGIYEVPPIFCSPCYPMVDLPVPALAAA
jgi:hypothetical protein